MASSWLLRACSSTATRHPRLGGSRRSARGLFVALAVTAAAGCAGATAEVRPEQPRGVPSSDAARQRALDGFGRQAYAAMAAGHPQALLFDDEALHSLLAPTAASRFTALRLGVGERLALRPAEFEPFRMARYAGVCLQNARVATKGGALGLKQDGWVFDRALVVGRQPGGRRVASWIEGTFLFTNAGFGALDLASVEAPRWEHSDLELATCDMEVGVHEAQHVGHVIP